MVFPTRTRKAALFAWFWLSAGAALAQQAMIEHQLKAAYLYKFAGFVEWPGGAVAHGPLLIGVAGDDRLADHLAQVVAARTVGGHALAVRRIAPGDSLAGLHILFVGALDRDDAADMLAAARGLPVLTVTDSSDIGAMVNFIVQRERLRFAVALEPVTASRLRISARMLAAASSVSGSAP